jgi:hypothetical protein
VITNRTVFLLGAGANVPYGFSTGGGLIDLLRGQDPRTLMGNAGEQITRAESAAFKDAVTDNMLPSIDAMLEHRSDLVKVGKRVMATLLYQQEAVAKPKSFDEDWMALIFDRMATEAPTIERFGQNPITFITFNYDRYLEYRFIRGLKSRYRATERDAWEAIKHMFLYLHGSLGFLPEQAPAGYRNPTVVPLGAPETDDVYTLGLALSVAENMIRIVHDDERAPAVFDKAHAAFSDAKLVLFLGFGFGAKNVERLRTVTIPESVVVDCTSIGMTDAEYAEWVLPGFPNQHRHLRHRHVGQTSIRQFLRERISYLK